MAYEARIDAGIAAVEALPMPTVAMVEGWAVGGGLAIATACDIRIATPSARFGVPIARTLGNCLSMANLARLVAAFGRPRVQRMLIGAEMLTAQEALGCGYLAQVVEADAIDAAATEPVPPAGIARTRHAGRDQGSAEPAADPELARCGRT